MNPGNLLESSVDGKDAIRNVASATDGMKHQESFSHVSTSDSAYKMNNTKRGYFIIFNNRTFEPSTGMSERSGTDIDATNLEKLFTSFGFKVMKKDNLKVFDMVDVLEGVMTENHSDCDCFGMAILSHGDDGIIYGTDDFVPLDNFLNPVKRCTTLHGKPKLFFIQACRGSELDNGVFVQADGDGETVVKIPIESDCLYAYSTVPGYYSWRNRLKGSWFIQSLVTVLEKELRHSGLDILRVLTRVNKMVAYEYQSYSSLLAIDGKKQVPYIASTLTKDLYLYPKIK